jgi:hypothetical protein
LSTDTKTALDAAIHAHLADECEGAIVIGYVFHAAYINPELDGLEAHGYFAEFAEGQPTHVTLGLAMMQKRYIENGAYGDDNEE